MKFSVVIPTMWRSDRTMPMLQALEGSRFIDEVVIVDNDTSRTPDIASFKKVKRLPQEKNIYVNPAWNLGVAESSNRYVAILNDDITFDVDLGFDRARRIFGQGATLIGLHQSSYSDLDPSRIASNLYGFGCCIFLDKSEWREIPDQLKVWFGDNWMIRNFSSICQVVIPVETEMSTTSDSVELTEVIRKDIEEWEKLLKQ